MGIPIIGCTGVNYEDLNDDDDDDEDLIDDDDEDLNNDDDDDDGNERRPLRHWLRSIDHPFHRPCL